MPHIIIYSFSVAICFLIGILAIFYLPVNRKGNFWFALFLFSLGFFILNQAVWKDNLNDQYPYIVPISELSRFLIAPFFYLSIWYYTRLDSIKFRIKLLHFLPAIVFVFLVFLPNILPSTAFAGWLPTPVKSAMATIMRIIIPLQILIYWALSYKLLKRHHYNIQWFSSKKTELNLTWLSGILLWQLFISIIWIVTKFNDQESSILSSPYLYLLIIFFIGYNLLKQEEVFFHTDKENQALKYVMFPNATDKTLPVPPRLTKQEFQHYKSQLDKLFETEEIYLNPNVNLLLLSEKMEMSLNDLSFLINTGYDMNFYTLINQYRIKKVTQMLQEDKHKHLTLLGIAYEAGFTSKSTFNASFKKFTGTTPSAFLKNIRR